MVNHLMFIIEEDEQKNKTSFVVISYNRIMYCFVLAIFEKNS